MKPQLIALTAVLNLVSGSLLAQISGPPRKPGAPTSPPGGLPFRSPAPVGVPVKPRTIVTPAPKPPTAVVATPPRTPSRPAVPTIKKVLPVTPALTPPVSTSPGRGYPSPTGPARVIPGTPPRTVTWPAIVNPPGPIGGPGAGISHASRALHGALATPPRRIAPPVPVYQGVTVVRQIVPVVFVREYDTTRNVVIVSTDDGQKTELPFFAIPVLFAPGTANLLDQTAVDVLQSLGGTLLDLYRQDNNVRFAVEGHTSTDAEALDGLNLSTRRASRIQAELVNRHGVPAVMLSVTGYGDSYADYRDGTEEQMQLDRRVLVVRTQ